MKKLLFVLILGLLVGAPAFAQEKPKTEKKQERPKPSVKSLLNDLSSEDYDTREGATLELIERAKTDKTVQPLATKLFKETKDPEVKARLLFVLSKIKAKNTAKKVKEKAKTVIPERAKQFLPKGFKAPEMPGLPKGLPEMPALPDIGKLFGENGPDFSKLLENMGLPKDLMNQLQKILQGEGDLSKILEEFMKLQNPTPQPEPKVTPKKTVPQPKKDFFGIAWEPVNPTLRAQLKLAENEGIVVTDIAPGSYADKAGLKKNDIILKVKGKVVSKPTGLKSLKKSGGPVVVLRNQKQITLQFSKWETEKRKDF